MPTMTRPKTHRLVITTLRAGADYDPDRGVFDPADVTMRSTLARGSEATVRKVFAATVRSYEDGGFLLISATRDGAEFLSADDRTHLLAIRDERAPKEK